jgi:hypothetical protein
MRGRFLLLDMVGTSFPGNPAFRALPSYHGPGDRPWQSRANDDKVWNYWRLERDACLRLLESD